MFRKLASVLLAVLLTGTLVSPAQASNLAGLVPTFGAPIPIAGGYVVQITNHDANFDYTAIGSDCSIATVSDGWLSVTGVLPSQTVKARVFTNRAGYDEGMAAISGSSAALSARGQVETSPTNATYSNHVVGPGGVLYVAWSTAPSAANLSKSLDGGQTWTLVKSWPIQSAAINARVAVDTDGDLAMVWQEGPNGSYRVMVSTSSDGGLTWLTPFELNPAQGTQLVSVEFTPSGDVLVSWNVFNGSAFVAPFRVSSDLGATWSATANASSPTEANFYPSLVKLSTGEIAMIWVNGAGIRAAMFDDVTNTFAASAVITQASVDIFEIGFSADSSGNLVAVWTAGGSGNKSVQFSIFNGTIWSTAETVSTAPGSYSRPQITKTSTSITVAWADSNNAVRIRTTSSLAPLTWRAEISPSAATTDLYQVKTTSFAPGKLAATWLRKSATTAFYHLDLVTSNDDGVTWSSPIQIATHNENNYQPIFMPNGLGQLAVLWRVQYPASLLSLKTAVLDATSPADPRSIYQVAEINPGDANSHAFIYDMEILNNRMYLIARHADTGYELFEFDGVSIRLVEDLWPGTGNGAYDTTFLANTGTALYFQGTNGITGYELYKFDGTSISLAADINPASTTPANQSGNLSTAASQPRDGAVLGNKLFFSSTFPSATTGYVFDLADPNAIPQTFSAYFSGWNVSGYRSPIVFGGKLYFIAGGGASSAIYTTDGTATPTLVPGTQGTDARLLGQFGTKLVYTGSPSGDTNDSELMFWDSSSPSTPAALAADINTFNAGAAGSFPNQFTVRCGELYFVAGSGGSTPSVNRELWKWDGFEATMVQDFNPGSGSGSPASPHVVGDELFIFANSPGFGFEPWLLTGSNFSMIQDIRPGADNSISGTPPVITWNGTVYTSIWGPTGIELYAFGVQPQNHQLATFAMNYTITYDSNGGTGSATATHPAGSVTLHAGSGFAMAGKVLLGWDTSSAATTPTHTLSDTFNLTGSQTLFAIWGDAPVQSSPGVSALPTITNPGGGVEGVSGGDLKLSGTGFSSVTQAEIDDKDAKIKEKTDSNLTLGLPSLNPGLYDLTLTTGFGNITLQDAVRVVAGAQFVTPEATEAFRAWTKANNPRTSVRFFAKNVVGEGKIQFLHNGKEIAWLSAVDESSAKIRSANGFKYLVRAVQLQPGKNVLEVLKDGKRVWRAAYTLRQIQG